MSYSLTHKAVCTNGSSGRAIAGESATAGARPVLCARRGEAFVEAESVRGPGE